MTTTTGERRCDQCGRRVLAAKRGEDGRVILLEPELTDGGWATQMQHGQVVAKYTPPQQGRMGHHAHELRCVSTRLLEGSRARIEAACTEPGNPPAGAPYPYVSEREAVRVAQRCDEAVLLPVVTPAGLRALVGASS